MKYFETPVTVKEVLFDSYEEPTKREPFGVLNIAFRLPHMETDWYVMEIKKDALHYLYSALIYHQSDETKEDLLPVYAITEDEHLDLLKAILNEPITQQALETYAFKPMIDVYVKQEPFEVVVCDCEGDVTDETSETPVHVTSYGFCHDSRMDAFMFYEDVVADYVDTYEQAEHPYFGMWTFPETGAGVTYVLLLFKGKLIRTKQEFDALESLEEQEQTLLMNLRLFRHERQEKPAEESFYFSFRLGGETEETYVCHIVRCEDERVYAKELFAFDEEKGGMKEVMNQFTESEITEILSALFTFDLVQQMVKPNPPFDE